MTIAAKTDDDNRWHLDKKVPIALVVALLVQAGSTIWFGAKLDSRVVALEDARLVQHQTDDKQDKSGADSITVLRTERAEAINLLRSDIKDVSAKLDRLIERDRK